VAEGDGDMSFLTVLYALLFYVAAVVLVGGLTYKVVQYAKAPTPLRITSTPAPLTAGGVAFRMTREVVFFESLFNSNKWIWLFGAMFHASLAVALLPHLRYFTEPVWTWVVLIQPFAPIAGLGMIVGLGGLWFRRFFQERVRYVSDPSDHLIILLLIAIAAAGLWKRFVGHTDIVAVKAFALGLIYFDWQPLPTDGMLLIHLALVALLMIVLPFSKLLHIPGVFFSPTRYQLDDARERRHLAPWAAEFDARRER
jgi:nitrate reductase gamma subunit